MLCATLTANADITLPASAKGAKSGGAAPLLQEAAPVNVRVPRGGAVEIPPKLDVRDDVDFGTVTIGSSMIEEITIENRGGGVLKGRASVDEPWKIVGKATYNLRVGETQKISRILTQARERGEVPWDWIVDETRRRESTPQWLESLISFHSDWNARRPISARGTATVVRAGCVNCAKVMSSKPITESAAGTGICRS